MDFQVSWELFQFWVASIMVILVITYELINPVLGKSQLYVNRKGLRNVAYLFVIIFIVIFLIKMYIRFLS